MARWFRPKVWVVMIVGMYCSGMVCAQADQGRRATFSGVERQQMLQHAYNCNRAGKSEAEERACEAAIRGMQARITQRTQSNHAAAEDMREQLVELYREQRQ